MHRVALLLLALLFVTKSIGRLWGVPMLALSSLYSAPVFKRSASMKSNPLVRLGSKADDKSAWPLYRFPHSCGRRDTHSHVLLV